MAPPLRLPSQLTYNDLNGEEALEILTDWFHHLLKSHPQFQKHLTLPMAKFTLDVGVGVEMHVGGTVPVASNPDRLFIPGNVELTNNLSGARPEGSMPTKSEATRYSTIVNAAPLPGGQPPDEIREAHDLPIPRPSYGPRDTGSHLFLSDTPGTPYEPIPPPDPSFDQAPLVPSGDPSGVPLRQPPPAYDQPVRAGEPATGYVFATEANPAPGGEQRIPLDGRGKIDIDLSGEGKMRQGGNIITGPTHVSSVKTLGDQGGTEYGSVAGTYDPGPAGLARPGRGGGGLYSDGRNRISFGNQRK